MIRVLHSLDGSWGAAICCLSVCQNPVYPVWILSKTGTEMRSGDPQAAASILLVSLYLGPLYVDLLCGDQTGAELDAELWQ